MTDSIKVPASMKAFAIGVTAGDQAGETLAAMTTNGSTPAERAAFYWLTCGTVLATRLPDAGTEDQLAFIAGAGTRAPSPGAVTVTIESVDGAAFVGDDEQPNPDMQRMEIARLLHGAAGRISDGDDEGSMPDINGNKALTFRVNLWG